MSGSSPAWLPSVTIELLGASGSGLIPKRRVISGVNRVCVVPVSSSRMTGSWWLSTACTIPYGAWSQMLQHCQES